MITSSKFHDFRAQKSTDKSKSDSPLHQIFKSGFEGSVHFSHFFATFEKASFKLDISDGVLVPVFLYCKYSFAVIHKYGVFQTLASQLQFPFIAVAFGSHLLEISPSEPSSLHQNKGAAATIQFQPGITGLTHGIQGVYELYAGQKQAATQTAPVRVGVINNRKLLIPLSQNIHPAHIGLGGHINGIGPVGVGSHVIAAKTGIPL